MNDETRKILKQLDDMIIDMDIDNNMAVPTGREIIETLEDARAFIEDEVAMQQGRFMSDKYKGLHELAKKTDTGIWYQQGDLYYHDDSVGIVHGLDNDDDLFIVAASPATIRALLDDFMLKPREPRL